MGIGGFDPLTAGASLVGGIIQNLWTDSRQEDAQNFNERQAQAQMEFQKEMSNTAYQRGMADMKAAGLNPILAYQRGPASSPTGALASTSFQSATDPITPALHSGMQGAKVDQELENMRQTNRNLGATNALIHEQTVNTAANSAKAVAETRNTNQQTLNAGQLFEALKADAAKAKSDDEFYSSPSGRILRILGTGGSEIGRAISPALNIIKRWP